MLHHDESDEHLVRRLEAFSDIVIGFSLAELSLSLTVPNRLSDLLQNSAIGMIAYAWTFTIICTLWFMHHRLFARAFVPGKLAIFLNFVWLGTVGLLTYLLQVYLHFAADPVASRLIYEAYFGLYGLNLAITAWLYAISLRTHNGRYSEEVVRSVRASTLRLGVAGGVVLILVAIGPLLSVPWFYAVVAPSILYGFTLAGFVTRFARVDDD